VIYGQNDFSFRLTEFQIVLFMCFLLRFTLDPPGALNSISLILFVVWSQHRTWIPLGLLFFSPNTLLLFIVNNIILFMWTIMFLFSFLLQIWNSDHIRSKGKKKNKKMKKMSEVMLVMADGDDDEGCKGSRTLKLWYHVKQRKTTSLLIFERVTKCN